MREQGNAVGHQHGKLSGELFEIVQWHQAIEFAITTQHDGVSILLSTTSA